MDKTKSEKDKEYIEEQTKLGLSYAKPLASLIESEGIMDDGERTLDEIKLLRDTMPQITNQQWKIALPAALKILDNEEIKKSQAKSRSNIGETLSTARQNPVLGSLFNVGDNVIDTISKIPGTISKASQEYNQFLINNPHVRTSESLMDLYLSDWSKKSK